MHNDIFVFGSNTAGRHGAGAAKAALSHFGAIYGKGEGLAGESYAIPTKDSRIRTLPLHEVTLYVNKFLRFALNNPDLTFNVTRIGCGLAGYANEHIAPLFANASENCRFDLEWRPFLGRGYAYFEGDLTGEAIIIHSNKKDLTSPAK